jgi:hypothetical protein
MTLTTHRLSHDEYSEALDYNRLPEPWRGWAKIASNFILQLDDQRDREDLKHDIIVRLAELAEKYKREGKPLTKWGCIRAAQYERLQFYHKKKRWKHVYSISLNSTIEDEDGYETEMIQTVADEKGIDLNAWLDYKAYYQSRPEKERRAIKKMLTDTWQNLSGYDWKLIKRFRDESASQIRTTVA